MSTPQHNKTQQERAFSHPKPRRVLQPPVDHLAEDDANQSSDYQHDSNFTAKVPRASVSSTYKKSRAQTEKLKTDSQYGQYLSVPKGNRNLFIPKERPLRTKIAFVACCVCVLILVLVLIVLLMR